MKPLLLLCLTLTLQATPFFPDFSRDGVSIAGSPLIGAPITSAGRYLFAIEDLRCPTCDMDFNDLFGEITYYGPDLGYFSFNVQGGLGDYYQRGVVGLAGARIIDGMFTLVFNTPTGEMYSGTNQVLIYRLADLPGSPVPEPSTAALMGLAFASAAILVRRRK